MGGTPATRSASLKKALHKQKRYKKHCNKAIFSPKGRWRQSRQRGVTIKCECVALTYYFFTITYYFKFSFGLP